MHLFFLDTKEEMIVFSENEKNVGKSVKLNNNSYTLMITSNEMSPSVWKDSNGFVMSL